MKVMLLNVTGECGRVSMMTIGLATILACWQDPSGGRTRGDTSADGRADSGDEIAGDTSGGGCLPDPEGGSQVGDDGPLIAPDEGGDSPVADGWYESEGGAPSDPGPPGDPAVADGGLEPADVGARGDGDQDSAFGDPGACPSDMVKVQELCMDRYEESRPDATRDNPGVDGSVATSRKDVLPWYANPMSAAVLAEFSAACEAAGKRLCRPDEWMEACEGPNDTTYVFGNSFSPEICNCVDTLCDDYCNDHSISLSECNLGTNCGYDCGTLVPETNVWCFDVAPTGAFAGCTNEHGTYDINGNVWEIVTADASLGTYEIRGGAFNCASPAARLDCSYRAGWLDLFAGFRCCRDIQ